MKQPFYSFIKNVNITYREDLARPSYVLENIRDVLGLDVNGFDVPVRPSRTSILNQFEVSPTDIKFLDSLMPEYVVGIGSKYTYKAGCNKITRKDEKLPDFNGLPHGMSLIVIKQANNGGEFFVDGTPVYRTIPDWLYSRNMPSYSWNRPDVVLLVPIGKECKIEQVTSGVMEVFTFPVYGTVDPYKCVLKHIDVDTTYTTKYHTVLNKINDIMENPTKYESSDRAIVRGLLQSMDSEAICNTFDRYRLTQQDRIFEPHELLITPAPHITDITYTVDGIFHRIRTNAVVNIPENATNIIINNKDNTGTGYLIDIKNYVTAIMECSLHNTQPIVDLRLATIPMGDKLPQIAFYYLSNQVYPSGAKFTDLVGDDAILYAKCIAMRRRVTLGLTSVANLRNTDAPIYHTDDTIDGLSKLSSNAQPDSYITKELQVIPDGYGKYEVTYTPLHFVLCVDSTGNEELFDESDANHSDFVHADTSY